MELSLYLKYFHDGKGSLERILTEVEEENREEVKEAKHIDALHPDEKDDGGIEKVISFGFTTKVSYRSAKRPKNKGRLYEKIIKIKQDRYSNSGNAWKVWDSGLVLARWVFANSSLIKDKKVHEIGAGCGLPGITASFFASETILSDYREEILNNLQHNVALNYTDSTPNISLKLIDFEKIYEHTTSISDEDKCDVLLSADVVYGLHLAKWLPAAVDALLKPDGVFYCVNPKNRWGVEEWLNNMSEIGFECSVLSLDECYWEDFMKKSCWDFICCKRRAQQTSS